MANVIKFKMRNIPPDLEEMYVRVTDLNRNELFSGSVPVANEINIGGVGSVGQGVLINADNYNGENVDIFKALSGYSEIELLQTDKINGPQSIIAFGDSFTHNGATYRSDNGAYTTKTVGYWVWINMLTESTFKVLDHAGVSGSKASDLLERIDDVLLSDASVVVILVGINDITAGVPISEITENMLNIVSQITSNGQYVVLCPVPHRNGDYNDQVDLLNIEYVGVADQFDNCFMVPNFDEFNSEIALGNISSITQDGLHPNTRGAFLLGNTIASTMDSVFDAQIEDLENIIINPEFSGVDGRVVYGATGTMPTSWRLEYADPTDAGTGSGTGAGASIDNGVITFRTGAESPTNQARVLGGDIPVEQNQSYVFDAIITIDATENITAFNIQLTTDSSDVGKASFQFQPPAGATTPTEIRISTPPINVGNSTTVEPIIQGYGTNLTWTLKEPRLFKV